MHMNVPEDCPKRTQNITALRYLVAHCRIETQKLEKKINSLKINEKSRSVKTIEADIPNGPIIKMFVGYQVLCK